jgi:hypothetical protein
MHHHRTRRSDAVDRRERRYRPAGDPAQRATSGRQHIVTELQRGAPPRSRADQDREQFRRSEGVRTQVDQPLARPLRPG